MKGCLYLLSSRYHRVLQHNRHGHNQFKHIFQQRTIMKYLVDPPAIPTVPVQTSMDETGTTVLPVHRIYCVGRNYADHIKEMGGDAKKDAPVFFCKPADAVLHCPAAAMKAEDASAASTTTTTMPFPLATQNLHHE